MQVARWWIAPAVFALDRITKQWVQSTRHAAFPLDIWPGVLRLTYMHNTGAAFGLLRGRTLLLALLTLVTLSGLCIWLVLHRKSLWPLPEAALWMMVGGAVGNLFDRLLYGYVIDFIEIVWFQFPVFNVADAFITISFILLVGWIVFRGDLKRNAPPVREDG